MREVTTSRPPSRRQPAIACSAARRPSRPTACGSELPTHSTTSNAPSQPRSGSASQVHTEVSTAAVLAAASRCVRATIASLASVATTSWPRSASPTASEPVPQAQSSTRAPGSTYCANASALPRGESRASGTRNS